MSPTEQELSQKKKLRADCQKELVLLNKEIAYLERSLGANVIVSDHACVRYFERVEGRDMRLIKATILPEQLRHQIEVLGNGEFPHDIDGIPVTLVVKNKTILTIKSR